MKKNHSGFAVLEIILIIVVVALLGLVGWYVYKNHHKTTTVSTATTSTSSSSSASSKTTTTPPCCKSTITNPYAGWKQYCSDVGGYCLKYPPDWSTTVQATGDPNVNGIEINPSSHYLSVSYIPLVSGIGGGCNTATCFFTTNSITPLPNLGYIDIVEGIFKNTDTGTIAPEWVVMSPKSISDYKLVVGANTDVGFFYPSFNNPNKNSNNTQSLIILDTTNYSSLSAANTWFENTDAITAGQILNSLSSE